MEAINVPLRRDEQPARLPAKDELWRRPVRDERPAPIISGRLPVQLPLPGTVAAVQLPLRALSSAE